MRRIVLLGCLYFAQGLPFGFFIQAVPVLLRSGGQSLEVSTLATLLAFPWGLKFLWAPVVDRARPGGAGRRRKFILPAQALIAVTLGVLAFFPPGRLGLGPLCAAFFVVSLMSAMQDVAADALAVDLLAEEERGIGNGVQVGGYRLGMIAGGGGVLVFIEDLGWRTSFLIMAAMIVTAAIPILLFREPLPPIASVATEPERRLDAFQAQSGLRPSLAPAPAHRSSSLLRREDGGRVRFFDSTRSFLRRPDVPKLVLLLLLYKAGDALSGGIVRPFLVDRGLSLSDIGKTLGIVGSVTAVAGALLGGWLLPRLGVRRGLVVFATAQAAAIAVYVAVAAGPTPLRAIYAAAGLEHFLGGAATAALFASMMGFCRDESRATDYTLQACVVVAVQGLGGGLSGFIAARAGYLAHFTSALLLAALAPFAVWLAWPARLAVASHRDESAAMSTHR